MGLPQKSSLTASLRENYLSFSLPSDFTATNVPAIVKPCYGRWASSRFQSKTFLPSSHYPLNFARHRSESFLDGRFAQAFRQQQAASSPSLLISFDAMPATSSTFTSTALLRCEIALLYFEIEEP